MGPLQLTLKKEVNREEVNKVLKGAYEDELKGIMEYLRYYRKSSFLYS
jgi:glyceraldehyde-3-phosphate dehydrogenase/erythrose-4-phosphate dehydrogenase